MSGGGGEKDMAEKKKPKDLDPKAKGAKVKGGKNIVTDKGERREFVQRTLKRVDDKFKDVQD
jgi:hypothetical protein